MSVTTEFAEDKPLTPALKLQIALEMLEPRPIYCECSTDCAHIVGYGEPLISLQQGLEILGIKKDAE